MGRYFRDATIAMGKGLSPSSFRRGGGGGGGGGGNEDRRQSSVEEAGEALMMRERPKTRSQRPPLQRERSFERSFSLDERTLKSQQEKLRAKGEEEKGEKMIKLLLLSCSTHPTILPNSAT